MLRVDFIDPSRDAESAARLARLIRSGDAEDARRLRGFRSPATRRDEPGPFLPPPQFGFHGRARELHDLERRFRSQRGVVLHAMGGMGKTALATEAAHWWTRSGLFRDGACFVSFEQFANAERVVQVLGTYLAGPNFEQLPAAEQRRRTIEVFRQKEVLMVWDAFENALPQFSKNDASSPYTDDERHRLSELFRDLTTGQGKGRLLVTCRPGETHLPSAHRFELHGLARADSLWLLSSIVKRDGLTLDDPRLSRERLDPLLDDLSDHPLSLELVGPHLRTLTPEVIRADFGKLLEKFRQDAPEERNQSLLASLEFSRRHLSAAAREALPWLGLFNGGVFEQLLLDVSGLAPGVWEPLRCELQSIALVQSEEDIEINGRPFLRYHPTLVSAAADRSLAEKPEVREHFIGVYLVLMEALDKAFIGSQSRAAIEILSREEANYRTAVQWAVADQKFQAAAALGDAFRIYLQRTSRLRERNAWVQWLKDVMTQQGFTEDAAFYEREHAWTRFTEGDSKGAVDQLQTLVERIRKTSEFDSTSQLALSTAQLGRVLNERGDSMKAIPVLQEATRLHENMIVKAGGQSLEKVLAAPDSSGAATELYDLCATMGDLANALRDAGQHDKALSVAQKALGIRQKLGIDRNVASGHVQCARILLEMARFDEAEFLYDSALVAARKVGDKAMEGTILQNQGGLARKRNQLERAIRFYQQALQLFHEAGNQSSIMRTYCLLGVVEQKAGRLAEARVWYEKSRELAVQLKDQPCLAQTIHNIGIVCQEEGEAARKLGDEPAARRHFEAALGSVEESLQIEQARGNKPSEADSWSQLAIIHLLLGNLDAAERHANEALRIHESLGLKEAWNDYNTLAEIAQARGDLAAAPEWAQKRDTLLEELDRRAGDGPALPAETLKLFQALTHACARTALGEGPLGPTEEEALSQIDQLPPPFPDLSAFLRLIAAGRLPSIPANLPPDLRQFLESVVKQIREAQRG